MKRIPAITDFRAKGTIMGPAGLTAVFGMGTGVTPPVWSPEMCPAGGQAGRARGFPRLVAQSNHKPWRMSGVLLHDIVSNEPCGFRTPIDGLAVASGPWETRDGSAPIGVVKLLGC